MKYNFSAGPAILHRSVIEEAAAGVLNLEGSGLSVLEISHRSSHFTRIIEEAKNLVIEILGLNNDYEVLFLSGGACLQFAMTAMNLLEPSDRAGFVDTGSWSSKAIKEAKRYGQIEVLASSRDKNYTYIPKGFDIPQGLKYIHITSNNTIYGTQFHQLPDTNYQIVCDMSSDIFSKPIDTSRFGIIYAGAQKNIGPAGTTLVILNREFIRTRKTDLPTMLDYQTHIQKNSVYNTPAVFAVYASMLNFRWIKRMGGLEFFRDANKKKAERLYAEIDRNSMFTGPVESADRSYMNACFLINEPELENVFLKKCTDEGIVGIKGHRSAGGFRASMYNALDMDSVEFLIEVMKTFEEEYG